MAAQMEADTTSLRVGGDPQAGTGTGTALLGALPSEAELIAALQRHSCWVCGATATSHDANLSHMMTHLQVPVPAGAPVGEDHQDDKHFHLEGVQDHHHQDLVGQEHHDGGLFYPSPQLFGSMTPVGDLDGLSPQRPPCSPWCEPWQDTGPGPGPGLDVEATYFREPPRHSYPVRKIGGLDRDALAESSRLSLQQDAVELESAITLDSKDSANFHVIGSGDEPHDSVDDEFMFDGPEAAAAISTSVDAGHPTPPTSQLESNSETGPMGRQEVAAEEAPPLVCAICLKAFTRRDHLLRHVEAEVRALSNRARKGKKKKAVVAVSPGKANFRCGQCRRVFVRKVDLCSHSVVHRRHTEPAEPSPSRSKLSRPFGCSVCGQRFLRRDHLDNHKQIHSDERPFQCQLCDRQFRRKSHLQVHTRKHDPEQQSQVVAASDLVRQHRPRPTARAVLRVAASAAPRATASTGTGTGAIKNEPSFTCCACQKKFGRRDKLKRHIRDCHLNKIPNVCADCGVTCDSRAHLVAHSALHDAERLTCRCGECGATLADRKTLALHHREHAVKASPKASRKASPEASSTTSTKTRIRDSPKTPIRVSPRNSPRATPNSRKVVSEEEFLPSSQKSPPYDEHQDLVQDVSKKHHVDATPQQISDNFNFMCDQCGALFIGEYTLKVHLEVHSRKSNTYRCYWCSVPFSNTDALRMHLKTH